MIDYSFIYEWQFWIVVILLIISGVAKAVQDTLDFHYWKSVFSKAKPESWWDSNMSWENKHKWFKSSKFLTWLISNPLVFITDAWHTFSLIRDFSIFSCIPILSGNYWVFLLYPVYRFVFHIFFTYVFIKK